MMASENLILCAPSSGRPDARNDDDKKAVNEADEGFAIRADGSGSGQHVIGITPV
jgi:hypothetical protein